MFYAHLVDFRGQLPAMRPISIASSAQSAEPVAELNSTLAPSATPTSVSAPAPDSPASPTRSRSMPSVSDYSTSTGASPPRADRAPGEAPSTFLTRLAAFPPPPAVAAALPRPVRTSTDSAAIAIGASMLTDPNFRAGAVAVEAGAGAGLLSPVAAEFGLRDGGAGWNAGPRLEGEQPSSGTEVEARRKKLSIHGKIKALFTSKSKSGLGANINLRPSALSTPVGSDDEDERALQQPRRNSFVGSIKRSAKYISLERARQGKPPVSPGCSAIGESSVPGSPAPGARSLFPALAVHGGGPSSAMLAEAEGGMLSLRGRSEKREEWSGARSVHPGHARHDSGTVKPRAGKDRRSVSWIKRRKASPLPSPALTDAAGDNAGGKEPAFSLDDGYTHRDAHKHVQELINEGDVLLIRRPSSKDKPSPGSVTPGRRPAPLVFPSSSRSAKVQALGDENAPLSAPITNLGKAGKSPRIDVFDDTGCLSAPLDPHKAGQQRARYRSGAARPILGQSDLANANATPFAGALASPTVFTATIPPYSYSDASTPSSSIMFGTKSSSAADSTVSSAVPSASPSAVAFHHAQVAGAAKRPASPGEGTASSRTSRRSSIVPPQSPLPTTLPPSLARTLLAENAGLRRVLGEAMLEMDALRGRNEELVRMVERLGGSLDPSELVPELDDNSTDEIRFAEQVDERMAVVSTPGEVALAEIGTRAEAPAVELTEPTPAKGRGARSKEREDSGEDDLHEMLEGLSYEAPGVMWEEMLREEREMVGGPSGDGEDE